MTRHPHLRLARILINRIQDQPIHIPFHAAFGRIRHVEHETRIRPFVSFNIRVLSPPEAVEVVLAALLLETSLELLGRAVGGGVPVPEVDDDAVVVVHGVDVAFGALEGLLGGGLRVERGGLWSWWAPPCVGYFLHGMLVR